MGRSGAGPAPSVPVPALRGRAVTSAPEPGLVASRRAGLGAPSLVLSVTPGQIERLLAAGARAYLTKPLVVPAFLKALDERLPAIRT